MSWQIYEKLEEKAKRTPGNTMIATLGIPTAYMSIKITQTMMEFCVALLHPDE